MCEIGLKCFPGSLNLALVEIFKEWLSVTVNNNYKCLL